MNKPSLLSSSLCPFLSLCVFPCACLNCCCCASASLCLCVSSQSAPYIHWNTEATEVRDQVQEVRDDPDALTWTISSTNPPATTSKSIIIFNKQWQCCGQLPIKIAKIMILLTYSSSHIFQPDKKETIANVLQWFKLQMLSRWHSYK